MKKIYYPVFLLFFIFSAGALLAKEASIDSIAKDIITKTDNLKPSVIKLALEAFYRAKQEGINIKKPILTVIDYTLPSTQKRLWVVDIEDKKVLYNSLVAHGRNSGKNYAVNFSNNPGSRQSSVGLFLTEDTYFGGSGYSLHLKGLEKGFNDKARARAIVLHGSKYVSQKFAAAVGRIGRSGGCQAVEKSLAVPIINTIKDGTLIFSFYPHPEWLSKSKFVNNQA